MVCGWNLFCFSADARRQKRQGCFEFSFSDADVYVSEGEQVSQGTVLCIVEAMKLFNEINAPAKCKIVKFLVKDGQAVEKGQPLIGIDVL